MYASSQMRRTVSMLKVSDNGVLPVIHNGIAHRQAGTGQMDAGLLTAPPEVVTSAARTLAALREVSA